MQENSNFKEIDEVAWVNHIYEFIRFYDKHKLLMDEISGIKERTLFENGGEKKFFIGKNNFIFAIKRLKAFIIDNLQYVPDYSDVQMLEKEVEELEKKFIFDKEYKSLQSKNSSLTEEEKIRFNNLYFEYILSCFQLANKLCTFLQSSLMVGTKDVKKYVSYYNNKQFFENLSHYRDEISNDLANFKFSNSTSHLRKILGYYYTYKILLNIKDIQLIDPLVNNLISYILHENTVNLIIKAKTRNNLDNDILEQVRKDTIRMNRVFSRIYYIVNKSLSERNILPKIQKRILIDRTLI